MPELKISNADASANILKAVDAGTLVQGEWHGRDDDGRDIACLLGAISPKVTQAADCNGKLMPMWFAELTPTLFDGIPADQIFPIARRYGELVGRWHTLSAEQWDRVLTRVLIRCIDDAVAAARPVSEGKDYWAAVEAACAQCRAAIESGDESAARSAARSAAWSAAGSAAGAARSAAGAAWSAAESAAWGAAWSAAGAAESAGSAAESAAGAARRAAYLSLFNFVLDQIEAECGAVS